MTRHPDSFYSRWRALVIVALFAVAAPATEALAQTNQPNGSVSASIVAGVNFAKVSIPLAPFPIPEVELTLGRRVGFVGGLLVEVPAAPAVSVDTGVLFSQRGVTMTGSVPGAGSAEADMRITYLDCPAHLRVGVAGAGRTRVSLVGGPTIGVKLDARGRVEAVGQTAEQDFTSELPALDFGLAIGGRVDAGRALIVVSYLHGLTDTTKGESPEAVKHRVWSVVAGWRF